MIASSNNIQELKTDQVFVFGSNLAGIHDAGAARLAHKKFGAQRGRPYGHYGQSFAIPTKDTNIETLSLDSILRFVESFKDYAIVQHEYTFLVTEIGCGLAGYTPSQIAPFFNNCPPNVHLPQSFIDVLLSNENHPD